MGREEKLVGGVVEKSECGGGSTWGFVFDGVLPRGMRSGASLRPSTLLSVSGSFWRSSHYALCEHVEASERTQSTSESMPMGEAGRAPLTKACVLKILFCLARRWRVQDQVKLLSGSTAGAHFPNIDYNPPAQRNVRFFLEHFIFAAKQLSALQ